MSDENIVVNTNYGPVRGRIRKSITNEKYFSFQGIPYAKPPIGELRFKDPQPATKWIDILDATKDGSPGPAPTDLNITSLIPDGNEDCLTVNVYTKEINPIVQRPVMVMIHGGGFVLGSSSENWQSPEFLLQKDIVFISMNYRLGAFGFMSISDKKYNIPGNAGLKDQTMSLRWARENCHHFGGDAKNITIFGISAGGASVHYHLISDHSRGLFDKAIVQSGSALNSWACRNDINELAIRLAKSLGWGGVGGIEAVVNLLQSAKTEDIALKQYSITELERQRGQLCGFVPCVEPYDNADGLTFLPKSVPELMKNAWGNQIPIIIGATSDEGYLNFLENKSNTKMFNDNGYFVNTIPRYLCDKIDNVDERERLGEQIKTFFYGDEIPTVENYEKYIPILSDILFWHGIFVAIKARLQDPKSAPTYLYRFNHISEVITGFKTTFLGEVVNACIHGEDGLYIIKMLGLNENILNSTSDARILQIFINAWTEFALNGDPNCKVLDGINWEPVKVDKMPLKCLNIKSQLEYIDLPETERMNFWQSIYNYGFDN